MTTENNKIIAEFMGLKVITKEEYLKHPQHETLSIKEYSIVEYQRYNSDWNWLMEVIDKIENLTDKNNFVLYDVNIYSDAVIILDQEEHEKVSITKSDGLTSKIEMVYNACVEFIKWYNEQNRKEN